MNVAARVGIGVGSAALAGFGAVKFADFAYGRAKQEHQELQDATADSKQQWEAWKAKLDAEFPGGTLATPQEHARFESFLQQHPAPTFVKVEHAEFTRVRLSTDSAVDRDFLPVEFQKSNGYPLAFGGMSAIAGAATLFRGVTKGGSTPLKTAGIIVGGALAAGMGAAMVAVGVNGFRIGEGTDGVRALQREINEY